MEKIIDKIRKLFRKAKGSDSYEESEAFSLKANKLLAQYNLNLSDIEEESDYTQMYPASWSYHDNQAGNKWRVALMTTLARHNFCETFYIEAYKVMRLVGKLTNTTAVAFMYDSLSERLFRIAKKTYASAPGYIKEAYCRHTYLQSFLLGATQAINEKLSEQVSQGVKEDSQYGIVLAKNNKDAREFVENLAKSLNSKQKSTQEEFIEEELSEEELSEEELNEEELNEETRSYIEEKNISSRKLTFSRDAFEKGVLVGQTITINQKTLN